MEFEDVAAVGQEATEEVPITVAVAESAAQFIGVVSEVTILRRVKEFTSSLLNHNNWSKFYIIKVVDPLIYKRNYHKIIHNINNIPNSLSFFTCCGYSSASATIDSFRRDVSPVAGSVNVSTTSA
jgi:hypothetical protein